MSLADRLETALTGETGESTAEYDSINADKDSVMRDFFRGFTAEEIERFFLNCDHSKRMEYIDEESPKIPRTYWWKFSAYVDYDNEAYARWGLKNKQTKSLSDQVICKEDEAAVQTLSVNTSHGESTAKTIESGTESTYAVARFLKLGRKIIEKRSESEGESETVTVEKQILECQTDRGECKLNRQAFIQYGREVVSRGTGNRSYIHSEAHRIAAEADIDVVKPGSALEGN